VPLGAAALCMIWGRSKGNLYFCSVLLLSALKLISRARAHTHTFATEMG
jgi:hypothetical protein